MNERVFDLFESGLRRRRRSRRRAAAGLSPSLRARPDVEKLVQSDSHSKLSLSLIDQLGYSC